MEEKSVLKAQERGEKGIKGAPKGHYLLKYYCKEVNPKIEELLRKIKERHGINFEIVINNPWDEEKDKETYEKYFKPKSRILKRRVGKPITKLRSKRAGHYFVSIPGTITLFKEESLEYWVFATEKEGIKFLKGIVEEGEGKIDECLEAENK